MKIVMKRINIKLLLVFSMLTMSLAASAQRGHGIAIDIGKNHPEDTTHVTSFSLGINSHTDTLKGVQINALSNYARNANGVQLSGFSNISSSPMKALQLSAITNISMGVKGGLQLAGLLNVSSGKMSGMQLGTYNFAEELNGLQLGVFNVATSHPKGWQVGIMNYTKDTGGHKIGLVNVNPSTTVDFMVYGGTSTKINGAVRFRNKSTYSITRAPIALLVWEATSRDSVTISPELCSIVWDSISMLARSSHSAAISAITTPISSRRTATKVPTVSSPFKLV